LEEGGPGRSLEFRRRRDAAWDELSPAQELADRAGLRAARPGLERAAALLEGILRDFSDHPKAKDIAMALGNTHMVLRWFAEARADYQRAIALARAQSAPIDRGGHEIDNFLLQAGERLAEAIRAFHRQWFTRVAWALLAAIGLALLSLRPWRAVDGPTVRLGGTLVLGTLLLALLAMGMAYGLRVYVDQHSPLDSEAAALLVALPGITGQIVALAFGDSLQATLRWKAGSAAGLGATLGVLAALAVATCVVNAFALFPFLDSNL
jgi:tetratricopeptide (TPR) repeat protein